MRISKSDYNLALTKVIAIGRESVKAIPESTKLSLRKGFIVTDVSEIENCPLTEDTLPYFMLYGEYRPSDNDPEEYIPVFSPEERFPELIPLETIQKIRLAAAFKLAEVEIA